MDYKELIGLLGCRKGNEVCKSSPIFYGFACDRCRETIMQEAATAIETLLTERDAAVEALEEVCDENPDACHLCKHMPCTEKYGRCIGWQWRGPQKGGRYD